MENTTVSCYHPALNQTSTYRSRNDQSVGSNGDEAVAFKKGGAAIGLLMPGSNPIHFSIICLRHGRKILGAIYLFPAWFAAPHICSAGRSTSMPRAPRTDYLCFPVSCVTSRLRIFLKVDAWQLSAPSHVQLTLSAPHPDAKHRDLRRCCHVHSPGCTKGGWVGRSESSRRCRAKNMGIKHLLDQNFKMLRQPLTCCSILYKAPYAKFILRSMFEL